jgi:hypothetical protein
MYIHVFYKIKYQNYKLNFCFYICILSQLLLQFLSIINKLKLVKHLNIYIYNHSTHFYYLINKKLKNIMFNFEKCLYMFCKSRYFIIIKIF